MMSLRVLRVIEGQIDSNSKFRTRTSVRGAGEVYTSNREVLPIFFPGRVVYGSVVCTAPHRPGEVYTHTSGSVQKCIVLVYTSILPFFLVTY